MIANKLNLGDEIRVIAPSINLTEVWQDIHHHAVDFWTKEGFNLTFSKNSQEIGKFHSYSIASRIEDIHDAFCDPNVKMIILQHYKTKTPRYLLSRRFIRSL